MHSVIVIAVGCGLLGLCAFVGRLSGGVAWTASAVAIFIPLWLVGAAINMYIGVRRAGYSVAEEAPVFVVVFAIPAAVAAVTWWRLR